MNNLIERTEYLINKLCKAVEAEDEKYIRMDDKYSNLIPIIIDELKKYLKILKNPRMTSAYGGVYALNIEFFANINKYIKEREFTPLLRTPEFKGLFDSSIRSNTQDMVVKFIDKNMASILKFSSLSNQVLRTNKIFEEELTRVFDYYMPDDKRYYRPCKVMTKLDSLGTDNLSALMVVSIYENGGFDKLCPRALEDKQRYEEAYMKRQKTVKKNPLGSVFRGLF